MELGSYVMELDLKFPYTLENPHIIANEQIHFCVIAKDPVLRCCRAHGKYYSEMGNTLVSLAKVVLDGMLVSFPIYRVMEGHRTVSTG
jgi:regulator of telomere elongation helicase 1